MSVETDRAGDGGDEVESVGDEELDNEITSQILNCPDVLAALQGRLHAEMMAALPAPVKRRIKALKKLQLAATNIEAKFFEEVHELECKYHKLYYPIYEKRGTIVSGIYEPNEEECEWASDDEEDLSGDMKNKAKIEEVDSNKKEKETEKTDEDVRGVPEFWLTIFKNVGILSEMVQEHDEVILKHLIDIQVLFLESNPMGFVLEFHFSPNDYFSNSVLTKEYEMKCVPEQDDPFSFEGPEIYKCKGCTIDWKKGKNITLKTVKKKQKHKSRGLVRTITKTVQNDSFFNFFTPPTVPDDVAEVDEETKALLTSDFEIGHYIRERIVPRAVLYFTGEGLEDEDYEEEEEEEDDEEDEEEDSDSPEAKQKNCKQQ